MTPTDTNITASYGSAAISGNVGGDVNVTNIATQLPPSQLLRATPPAPPAHFTGREDDLAKFTRLLTSGQSVAITALQGMGGIGKTALAQKLAEQLCLGDHGGRPYFPGGVLWWSLGPNPDVITALDVWARYADPRADLSALPTAEARAEVVRSMLAQLGKLCAIIDDVWDAESFNVLKSAVPPGCPLLMTTRDGDLAKSLRCRVERIDALSDDEALALLAKLLGPLNGHEEAACDIAHLTEGLPLALELICGLADSPADLPSLAKQLREKPTLDVLQRGTTREQSIEACFVLSYNALDADLQRRFRALGVFAPAPFDRDAIAAVWDEEEEIVNGSISQLVRRSLLTKDEATQEYKQHALLHDYALKLLRATPSPVRGSGDIPANASDEQRTGEGWRLAGHPLAGGEWDMAGEGSRHADYYRRFTEEQDWHAVEHAFEQIDWGWRWVQANTPEQIIDYAFAVQGFLNTRGRKLELLKWLNDGLTQARVVQDRKNEGALLNNIGLVYSDLGQPDKALDFCHQALAIKREVGDRPGEGVTLNNIAAVYDDLGQKDKALDFYQQALAITREVGDRFGEGTTLSNIGLVYDGLGQKDKALDFYQQALAIKREVGDRSGEGGTLNNIGVVYRTLGQSDKALDFYQQALAIRHEVGDRFGEGTTLSNIGLVYDGLGQKDKALDTFGQALAIKREVGDRSGEGGTLNNIGVVYRTLGQPDKALDFYQQALAICREVSNRSVEGTTLNNIGLVYNALGQPDKALDFYQQALAVFREVGDRWSESVLLSNIGLLLDAMGRTAEAVTYLEQNVAMDEAIGHPELESDRATLERVRDKLQGNG